VYDEEKKKKDDSFLFLFSDLLVLSKPQPKGVYKFKSAINLQYASIAPVPDGGMTNIELHSWATAISPLMSILTVARHCLTIKDMKNAFRLHFIVGKDAKKSILIAGHTPAERDLLQKRIQTALSQLEQYQGRFRSNRLLEFDMPELHAMPCSQQSCFIRRHSVRSSFDKPD
jgi:hypothetical protein